LANHHQLITAILASAVIHKHVSTNVAKLAQTAPARGDGKVDPKRCWPTADCVPRFLQKAQEWGTQTVTRFRLQFVTAARKGEILSLRWANVNFETGELTIAHTLHGMNKDGTPKLGSTKTKQSRV